MKCITSKKTIGKVALLSLIFFSISMYGLLAQLNRNPYEENANEPNDEAYRIIKFSVLPGVEEKTGLALEGIQLLEFVGQSSYLAKIKKGISFRSNLPGVKSISRIDLRNKCTKQIFNGEICSESKGSKAILMIQHMPLIQEENMLSLVSGYGLNILKYAKPYRMLYVECETSKIRDLINQYWIQYVSCAPEPGEPEDREGKTLHRVNQITSNTKENIFLDGSGVKVCVRDDGFVGPHVDFKGRINNQVYGSNGTHGDMVSGIVCGAGNIDPVISGMATAAELFVINYQDDFLDATLDLHQQNGVVITNSSYSNGCNLGYTAITQIVDKQIYENPSLLHVFSAGNSNNQNCGYGAGNQWGNITGGHKIGKNVLTAANVQINGLIDPSSSRGPTKDGRLKPDVASRGMVN
ncbi:MAG: S8 family serine peptidase [Saprospiraceae bacterium]|nr:S8 family serine peptidase [Candidatus Vicinibacter affinis]